MRDHIFVYMKERSVSVLGPGNRYVLWVQGCHRKCKGCVAEHSHVMENGKKINIGALAMEIALSDADGLTISGGEPFLQAEELAEMISKIHEIRPMGVIVYSGFKYEELQKNEAMNKLLNKADLLIDGEYIEELDDGKSLRGSSNQRAIPLTDLYKDDLHMYGAEGRQNEIFYHGIEIHKIGIPRNN